MSQNKAERYMDFGDAMEVLKSGGKVARKGWNGTGMYIYYMPGLDVEVDIFGGPQQIELEPCVVMFTAKKTHQPGWLASQPDLLSSDWVEIK